VIALQVTSLVLGSLAVLVAVVFGLLWLDLWRQRRAAHRERIERVLRDLFQPDEAVPTDVVDGPWDRSSREIHHMTVPELQAVNDEFLALIEENFPNQT
jgi:hypothetical protein